MYQKYIHIQHFFLIIYIELHIFLSLVCRLVHIFKGVGGAADCLYIFSWRSIDNVCLVSLFVWWGASIF